MGDKIVIDLTLESDEEKQTKQTADLLSLFTKRQNRKRKSERNSEESAFASSANSSFQTDHDHKPVDRRSEATQVKTENRSFKVVVPASSSAVLGQDSDSSQPRKKRHGLLQSDSQVDKKPLKGSKKPNISSPVSGYLGISTQFYPVDAHEERASRGAYPKRKTADHDNTSLSLTQGKPNGLFTDHHKQTHSYSGHPIPKTLQDKLAVIKGPRVTLSLENGSSYASLANFSFVNGYKIRNGVKKADESFNAGCTCGIVCDPGKCSCLSQEIDSDNLIIPYQRLSNGTYVLRHNFIKRTAMIYECTSLCGCNRNCWNRVVERGRTIRFDIFSTGNRGFGLRSPDHIKAGQFIDLYLGEVITRAVADKRENKAQSQKSPSYLFSLDFLVNDNKIYVVDGAKCGSPTRFMNHSCNPNCKLFPVSRHHGDDRLYDLAFFSLRDIAPMTELTFDYNPGWDGRKKKNDVDPNAVKCLCGEPNCRGQLWPNQRKRTKRNGE